MSTIIQEAPLTTDFPENWEVILQYDCDLADLDPEDLAWSLAERDEEQVDGDPDKMIYLGINSDNSSTEAVIWFIQRKMLATQKEAVGETISRTLNLLRPEKLAINGLASCMINNAEINDHILELAGAKPVMPDELEQLTVEDLRPYLTTDTPEIDVTAQAQAIFTELPK